MPRLCTAPERRKLRDSSDEIRSAAAWARKLLESDPKTQIGIIVAPDLTRSRPSGTNSSAKSWRCGRFIFPLGRRSRIIQWYVRLCSCWNSHGANCRLPRAGMLLRSPFLGGSEKEWGKRAQLDAKLRKNGVWDMIARRACTMRRAVVRNCSACCGAWKSSLRKLPEEQRRAFGAASIADLLEAFGWPGDRTPSSREFQTIEAWRGLLSSLASLDLTAPPMNLAQVIDWLQRQAANTRFQAEDEGAPVQVMGMLEAAGLRFDHLWIMGLHDEALPAPANPNPFLPTSCSASTSCRTRHRSANWSLRAS